MNSLPMPTIRRGLEVITSNRPPCFCPMTKRASDTSTLTGLSDRALIGGMITVARIGAVLQMNVGDYFTQARRGDMASVGEYEKVGIRMQSPECADENKYMDDDYHISFGILTDAIKDEGTWPREIGCVADAR